ncbi:hypothetical protein [Microbacterium sp. cf332]|uniref:hypothetical protein n=1 Tax=Microbacterium sp. cf332 TaxID=1761804 RepID=UPI00115F7857|nr:hypothetical protein [Microbacterium sp. cf332]
MTQLEDGLGALDHKRENVHASIVGIAVDYLSRLADIRLGVDDGPVKLAGEVFRASLLGARRLTDSGTHSSAKEDAARAILSLNILEHEDGTAAFVIDDDAARIACQLATYDVALRAGPAWYNPESTLRAPDETATSHILSMVERSQDFFEDYGPILEVAFVFVDEDEFEAGGRGGYSIYVDSGDGDFLTEDTLWDFKVSALKPNKDHTLQLVMYYLMGKQSGLPQFATQTHVGIFNPRMNAVYRLAVEDVPAEVLETVRRDVIGYEG